MSEPITRTSSISDLEYYKIIRDQIEHEDNLVGQRQSWFISSQSFLFTAYAITVGNLRVGTPAAVMMMQQGILSLIPLVSMAACILTMAGAVAGLQSMRNLRLMYHEHCVDVRLKLPPIQGYRRTFFLGQAGPVLLPILFFCVWVLLLLRGLNR